MLTSVHPHDDVRIFYKEAKALADAGHEVVMIAPHDVDEQCENIRIISVLKAKNRYDRIIKTTWQLFRNALKEKAHVYHFHDPELIPIGLLLQVMTGAKVIYDVHEDYPGTILSRHWMPCGLRKPVSFTFKIFENLTSRFFSAIVSATPPITQKFGSRNKNIVTVQNFPILDDLFTDNGSIPWHARRDAVVYIGVLERIRGITEMIESIAIVSRNGDSTLILAGKFDPPNIQTHVENMPIWQRVEYKGTVPHRDIKALLDQSRIGLVLFHPEPQYEVCYPTKLFEYMAAALPVVASDFPLWRTIVGGAGCGLLVDPLDPHAIAHAIIYLLDHPDEAEKMGKSGRKAIEHKYNWNNEKTKLLKLYDHLLDK